MPETRIYSIHEPTEIDIRPRLVRAISQAQALRHVAEGRFRVEVAKQEDIVSLMTDGVTVETAAAKVDL